MRHFSHAGVVREALEGHVRQVAHAGIGKRAFQQRQFLIDNLVEQRVGFRSHANTRATAKGAKRGGQQVSHRLADARTRFNHQIRARRERFEHLFGHYDLFIARLEVVIQTAYQAIRGKCRFNFLGSGEFHWQIWRLRIGRSIFGSGLRLVRLREAATTHG